MRFRCVRPDPDPDGAGELEAPTLAFTYFDGSNLVASSTDAAGNTTYYDYDAALRVSRVTPTALTTTSTTTKAI